MGKTNPTYRDQISAFEEDWQSFRRALRRQHQEHFDELLVHARDHADAGGVQNPVEPRWAIMVSMVLGQQQEIAELQTRLAELKEDG